MTFREKALENLIMEEVRRLRTELSKQLLSELDKIHADVKSFAYLGASKEYTEKLERLNKLNVHHTKKLLNFDYDEFSIGHSGENSIG